MNVERPSGGKNLDATTFRQSQMDPFELRPGNTGSNTAADHISVLGKALAQIPSRHRRDVPVTVDGAGAIRELVSHPTTLDAVPERRVLYRSRTSCVLVDLRV